MQHHQEQQLQRRQQELFEQLRLLQRQIPPGASADTTHPWLAPVNIQVPTSASNTVPPWSALKLNPVGLYALRRWQGIYPLWDHFYSANQHRFRAADLAWLASGTHNDGRHLHSIHSFHPSQIELTNETSSAGAKAE
jgi:hypothetical protein